MYHLILHTVGPADVWREGCVRGDCSRRKYRGGLLQADGRLFVCCAQHMLSASFCNDIDINTVQCTVYYTTNVSTVHVAKLLVYN